MKSSLFSELDLVERRILVHAASRSHFDNFGLLLKVMLKLYIHVDLHGPTVPGAMLMFLARQMSVVYAAA